MTPNTALAVTLSLFICVSALAQPDPLPENTPHDGSTVQIRDKKKEDPECALYNSSTVTQLTGIIIKVITADWLHATGKSTGIYLRAKFRKILTTVYVAPQWFIPPAMEFKKGDVIEVIGSQVMIKKKPVIVAKWIRNGEKEILLRNYDGTPFWNDKAVPGASAPAGGGPGGKGGPPGGGGGPGGGMPGR